MRAKPAFNSNEWIGTSYSNSDLLESSKQSWWGCSLCNENTVGAAKCCVCIYEFSSWLFPFSHFIHINRLCSTCIKSDLIFDWCDSFFESYTRKRHAEIWLWGSRFAFAGEEDNPKLTVIRRHHHQNLKDRVAFLVILQRWNNKSLKRGVCARGCVPSSCLVLGVFTLSLHNWLFWN